MFNNSNLIIGLITGLMTFITINPASGQAANKPSLMPGIAFDQGKLYALAPGEAIFLGETFRWYQPPLDRTEHVALRTALNLDEPITVEVSESGTLYAVLWQWDFGFLAHTPSPAAASVNLHGWRRVGPETWRVGGAPQHRSGIARMDQRHEERLGPAPQSAPAPFAPMHLYRRDLTPGTHKITLNDYIGQWVIVGYEVDAEVTAASPIAPEVALVATQTRHNIINPGETVSATAAGTIERLTLYHKGRLILETADTTFAAPAAPGRYCLEVTFADTRRLVPLTVAYPPIAAPGWPEDFFPIHFYGGWGYIGLFNPNDARRGELHILNQFELGANTFFTGPGGKPLVNALNARAIRMVRGKTKYATREVEDDARAEHYFLWEINRHGPFLPNDLGFYVEDEPLSDIAPRMSVLQEAFGEAHPDRHMIYCLHGARAPEFWRIAGPTIRQTRSYPIRRRFQDDYLVQITPELADYLITCQEGEHDSPLWLVAQSFGDLGRPGGLDRWDQPTPEQLRLMINLSLARGIKGLTYFCFDGGPTGPEDLIAIVRYPYVPHDEMYHEVERLNAGITQHAVLLNGLTWQEKLEQPNPKLDVQLLTDADGRSFAYVTAFSYDRPVAATLTLPQLAQPRRVNLQPGAAVLIDLVTSQNILVMPGI